MTGGGDIHHKVGSPPPARSDQSDAGPYTNPQQVDGDSTPNRTAAGAPANSVSGRAGSGTGEPRC